LDEDGAPAPAWGALETNLIRTTTPYLRRAREGGVCLLTSVFARMLVEFPGTGPLVTWANTVTGLFEGVETELRQAHVRSALLSLGLTRSPFGRAAKRALGKSVTQELVDDESAWVQPADVARAVCFVMDPASVNGMVSEMVLAPQRLLERVQTFNDYKRVEQAVAALTQPAFRDARVALVTGAGKGIGRGVALELARAGFDVAALTRTQADLDSLRGECAAVNPTGRFLGVAVDVTDRAALAGAVRRAVDELGTLSCVVSNAGTNKRRVAALADIETWAQVLEVDLVAAMNLTRLALPWLIRHAKASADERFKPTLCFISSQYAHPKGVKMSGLTPYLASKAGTNAFAGTVMQEVRDLGVQVTTLMPGVVATDLGLKPNAAAKDGQLLAPQHLLTPADCGRAVVLVASFPRNCAVQDIVVDNLFHTYPAVRNSHAKWLASLL